MGRYTDRERYFLELAQTSRDYYIDYIRKFKPVCRDSRILEIGCGEGGNLLPFASLGCHVAGLDLAPNKISNAKLFFEKRGAAGEFYCADFLSDSPVSGRKFDIILIHDVIEHIEPECKGEFFRRMKDYLTPGGIVFFGFPAWQMPFGGHQQICRSRMCRLPFIHLLPKGMYRAWLGCFKENPGQIDELMSIKRSKMTPEKFVRLCRDYGYEIEDRTLWLISPHYRAKFNLRPAVLCAPFSMIPYLRNFFCTSCFFVISAGQEK